eukprot:TRINITY_DN43349_c0_g1_i2.p1 TRINITY_DN43349_c0_g1~~TRINITY_DN43349_c0_g1_i2.p1  ORF type:complete len:304 (+),score=53.04 TRINITY_DN43349_c0_g1_i2:252-1163(+)
MSMSESVLQEPAMSLVPPSRELLTLESNQTAHEAIRALGNAKVLSAPVFHDGFCVGSLDIADCLTAPPPHTVLELVQSSGRERLKPFFSENPISFLIEVMAEGCPRVALFSPSRELLFTCSCTDLLKWMHSNLSLVSGLPPESTLPAEMSAPLNLIPVDTTLGEALKSLCDPGTGIGQHGLGIIDQDGKLVGCLSATDLRYISGDAMVRSGQLEMGVVEYLDGVHPGSLSPITLPEDQDPTIQMLVQLMVENHLHRLWTVDLDGRPVRCIDLPSIFKACLAQGEPLNDRQLSGDIDVSKLWRA